MLDQLTKEVKQFDATSGAFIDSVPDTQENLGAPIDLAFRVPEPRAALRAAAALVSLLGLGAFAQRGSDERRRDVA